MGISARLTGAGGGDDAIIANGDEGAVVQQGDEHEHEHGQLEEAGPVVCTSEREGRDSRRLGSSSVSLLCQCNLSRPLTSTELDRGASWAGPTNQRATLTLCLAAGEGELSRRRIAAAGVGSVVVDCTLAELLGVEGKHGNEEEDEQLQGGGDTVCRGSTQRSAGEGPGGGDISGQAKRAGVRANPYTALQRFPAAPALTAAQVLGPTHS